DQLLATRPASPSMPVAETAEAGASADDAAYRRADVAAAPATPALRAELTPKPGDMKSILQQFGAMDSVQWAVVADREGFLIESTAAAGVDAEVAGALSAGL